MALRAVIFDMDGVLVDSEPLWAEAERRLLQKRQRAYDPKVSAQLLGLNSREAVALLQRHYALEEPVEAILRERLHLVRSLFEESLQPTPGARRLLQELHLANLCLGLASASPRELVQLALEHLGAQDLFKAVISGDDVERGKPHPDIYLRAAALLGVDPGECVVIEDAPNGVMAAKRAGMRCLALCTSVPPDKLAAADAVVSNLEGIDVQFLKDLAVKGMALQAATPYPPGNH